MKPVLLAPKWRARDETRSFLLHVLPVGELGATDWTSTI